MCYVLGVSRSWLYAVVCLMCDACRWFKCVVGVSCISSCGLMCLSIDQMVLCGFLDIMYLFCLWSRWPFIVVWMVDHVIIDCFIRHRIFKLLAL